MSSPHLVASPREERVDTGRIWRTGLLAIVVAVVANVVAFLLLNAVLDLPEGFLPLSVGPIAVLTTVGVAAATAVFALVARMSERPLRVFRIVGLIAFVLSILPNVALAFNPAAAPVPNGTMTAFLTLIVFHIIAAAVAIGLLTTRTVETV